jgi:enoyl-CoA hydratase
VGPVGHVALARPEALNVLDRPTASALHAAVTRSAGTPGVRCLVVRGDGASFSAGGDLRVVQTQTAEETLALNRELLAAIAELEHLPIPSIALLHGHVLGGGLELSLGCTLRVAASDVRIGLPEVRVGLIPGSGGVARLPRLIGHGAALRLLLTGETVGAEEALRLGLVQAVAAPGEAEAVVQALAERIAANAPLAVRAILELVCAQGAADADDAIGQANARLPELLASEDLRHGLDAFAERQPPRFTGS